MSYAPLDDNSEKARARRAALLMDEEGAPRFHEADDTRASLAEPLTANGQGSEDPFFVFRKDLYRKLEQVDEGLAEYLRIVHQTVRSCGVRRGKGELFRVFFTHDGAPSLAKPSVSNSTP
jgi:hypothetical protein